jgi:hypothetical protein
MRKAIKEFGDKIDLFKKARDETVNYINKRVAKKIRRLRKYEYRITRKKGIKFEITVRLGDNPRFRVSIRISAWIIRYRYVSIQNRFRHRFLVSYRPLLSLFFIFFLSSPFFSFLFVRQFFY